MVDPVDRVVWRQAAELKANGWNPNVVLNNELRLLELSIFETGWIQPIIISKDDIVIDGFHRWRLSQDSKALREKYAGRVPCVILDLEPWEAMLLTVRINRAKGTHQAVRMSSLVKEVIDVHGVPPQIVADGIGATLAEVDLLYQDSLFKAKGLKDYKYSKAWIPEENGLTETVK